MLGDAGALERIRRVKFADHVDEADDVRKLPAVLDEAIEIVRPARMHWKELDQIS